MPELPEVETLRRELLRSLKAKKIKVAAVLWAKTVKPLSPEVFVKQISGQTIKDIERQAKMLIVNFSGPLSLAFHLKMTGQLIYEPPRGHIIIGGHPDPGYEEHVPNKHTRLILEFTDKSKLYFNDMRKFGWARLIDDTAVKNLAEEVGVEPLSKKFTTEVLIAAFARYPNRTIKQILMDQSIIAGIGNIYADESCFAAKVRPDRKVKTLSVNDIKYLHDSIIKILKLAIEKKGTSSRNYRKSDGQPGGFVPYLKVYGRGGQPCKVCRTTLKKIKHNGRGTVYCPHCQK